MEQHLSFAEKRKYERFPCLGMVHVYWGSRFVPALLADSSLGGSRIFTQDPISISGEVKIVIPELRRAEISVYGKVVWQKRAPCLREFGLYLDFAHGVQYIMLNQHFFDRIIERMGLKKGLIQ